MTRPDQTQKDPSAAALRGKVMALAAVAVFFVILIRLFALQVVHGDEYREKSMNNFIHFKRIEHDRGQIVDREGRILVTNRPSTNVYVTPAFLPPATRFVVRLGRAAGLSHDDSLTVAHVLSRTVQEGGPPILLARDLTPEAAEAVRRMATDELDLPLEAIPILEMPSGHDVDHEEQGDLGGRPDADDDGDHDHDHDHDEDPRYAAYLDPDHFPSTGQVLKRLEQVMGLDEEDLTSLRRRIRSARNLDRYLDIVVRRDVSTVIEGRIERDRMLGLLPGVFVRRAKTRRYEHDALAAHVLGYVNELSARELDERREAGYRIGDIIGRRGVEETFEDELRGVDGRETAVVDSRGLRQRTPFAKQLQEEVGADLPARAGNRVVLTLDMDIQRAAEEAFPGRAGSVVVMEVNTGRLLALTSTPTYNPAKVSGTLDPDERDRLKVLEPLRPWRFRAIQDHFAPGSTFKVVTALAALTHGASNGKENIVCPGAFRLGNTRFRCWKDSGHGPVDLINSIAKSCDVYYYTMGARLGLDPIAETAELLGFGHKTGIPLFGESAGIMPTKAWYNSRHRGSYTLGAAVNASIGQGAVTVTPIQLAVAYAAIANGGTVYQPQVALRIESQDERAVREIAPRIVRKLDIEPAYLAMVHEGLREVVNAPHGTAYRRRLEALEVSGKTGTAQVAKLGKYRLKVHELEWKVRDHAWFASFAPSEHPEVVVVVFNEHGGGGSSAAAPAAMQIVSAWWTKKTQGLAKSAEAQAN
ncbi:MAG: penicillin-binding protein 2 [Deltaproteobacteria bacterium]|nr:penicillin-binding protein 2 [Deltaproteobacteria bacterium]